MWAMVTIVRWLVSQIQPRAKLLRTTDDGAGVEFANDMITSILINIDTFIADGMPVKYGDVVFHVSGSSKSILKAERMVLNSMQRMSAIATKTNSFVKLLEGTNTKILDTVKLRLVSALQRSGQIGWREITGLPCTT
jgi:nicotinate-nucleotide pyrophosphorylase (carboxylating)